jgi:hypothetical protein
MANIRTLKLNLLADVSNFNKELGGVQGKLKGFQSSLKQAGQVSSIALGGLAAAGYTAVKAAEEVAVANGRLDNILTSMGYPEATKRVQDYAQALEDPIKGITALTKSGITFTDEEKKKIETMVKSGDVLGAQTMILEAIEKQVGGTAEATATGSAKMALALGNVSEAIGGALLPFFTQLSEKVIEFTPFLEANAGMFLKVGAAIAIVAVSVKTLQLGIAALSLVMEIATGITAAFNFVLALNPIGLVVLAVAALAAGFVLAYQKIEPFRNLIDDIYEAIKKVGNAIANSAFGNAIGGIIKNFGGGKAAGGSVSAGSSYRVGEFGAEYFTPNSSGVIRRDNGGGGGNTFIFNGVIDGESARRSIEQLLQNSARRTGAVNFVGATL